MKTKIVSSIALGMAFSASVGFAAATDMETTAPVAVVSSEELESTPALSIEERLAALEAGNKKSDWSNNVKIRGDMRYRFEYISVDGGDTAQNRQRIRVRLGAFADVNDFTKAGVQIRTGGGANSGNQTIGGTWDNKEVFFDLAYINMKLNDGECGELTLGKMKYPWKTTTDLIWDSDVNPEGIAHTYSRSLDCMDVFSSIGGFKVEEDNTAHDLNLFSAQLGGTKPLNDDLKLTAGGSLFAYANAPDFGAPVDYSVVELFSEASLKNAFPKPVKFYGNYVNNIEESDDSQGICVGFKINDAKKAKWEAKFDLRRLEENAAPAPFADSDFAGGGTGVKGVRAKAAYNIAKHLQVGITGISGKLIDGGTDVKTLHLDLIASF